MKENNKLWIVISILTLLVGGFVGYMINNINLSKNNKTEVKNDNENNEIIEEYDTDNLLRYVAIEAGQSAYSGKITEEIAANALRYYYIHDIDTRKYGIGSMGEENINDKYTLIKKQYFEKTIKSTFNHEFSETYKKILNFKEENDNYRFEWVSGTGSYITIPVVTSELISKKSDNNKKVVNYEIKCEYLYSSDNPQNYQWKETTIGEIEIDSIYNKDTKSFVINNISYTSFVEDATKCAQ